MEFVDRINAMLAEKDKRIAALEAERDALKARLPPGKWIRTEWKDDTLYANGAILGYACPPTITQAHAEEVCGIVTIPAPGKEKS